MQRVHANISILKNLTKLSRETFTSHTNPSEALGRREKESGAERVEKKLCTKKSSSMNKNILTRIFVYIFTTSIWLFFLLSHNFFLHVCICSHSLFAGTLHNAHETCGFCFDSHMIFSLSLLCKKKFYTLLAGYFA